MSLSNKSKGFDHVPVIIAGLVIAIIIIGIAAFIFWSQYLNVTEGHGVTSHSQGTLGLPNNTYNPQTRVVNPQPAPVDPQPQTVNPQSGAPGGVAVPRG